MLDCMLLYYLIFKNLPVIDRIWERTNRSLRIIHMQKNDIIAEKNSIDSLTIIEHPSVLEIIQMIAIIPIEAIMYLIELTKMNLTLISFFALLNRISAKRNSAKTEAIIAPTVPYMDINTMFIKIFIDTIII